MADPLDRLRTALAGRYTLERELGAGGMAVVYLARDLKHDRPVALKVVRPELTALLGPERFLREIAITGRLQHPHILPLLDSGEADGLLYYVMPYVAGETLRQRLERERQLPVEEALRLTREVAEALDYAHRQGVVHRDLKPENLLLEEGHAVVADFGIARAVEAAGGEKLTATGTVLGTPFYMSPEQAMGGVVDGRSDQYSLGCVLYELLAGTPPFVAPSAEGLVHQHLSVVPRPVSEVRPSVPGAVTVALQRALAKTAADRYETAGRFGESLGAAMPSPARESVVSTSGPPANTAAGKPARPRPRRALVGAVLLVLLTVGAFAAWKTGVLSDLVGGRPAHPTKKDWILVAEFEGPADDSSLAVVTRDLVSAALDQSEIVATVPRDQIRLALEMAGKPTDTRVDAELAQELAYRRSIRAVLEGKIGRLGKGYSVVVRVVEADSLKVVLTERAVAKNQDDLIPTLGRLAERLRAGLGERRGAIRATRPLLDVATPSLEAYRLCVQGQQMIISGRSREAVAVLRDALALDPDFAFAWRALGNAFNNVTQMDSALAALDQALRRPDRLTTVQRLLTAGDRARFSGELQSALATYERALQYDPTHWIVLSNSGQALWALGRFEESLERTRIGELASPFGVSRLQRNLEVYNLTSLGRIDEAREVARYLKGAPGQLTRTYIEIAAHNWAAAESAAVILVADRGLDEDQRSVALGFLGSAQAARGALRTAAATYERAQEIAPLQDWPRRCRLMLAVASGGAMPVPPDAWAGDSSTATLLTRGLRAAIAGDRAQAQRLLNVVRGRPRHELSWQGATPALLEARIEALAGRWGEAARILQPIAWQPMEIGWVIYPAGMWEVRWFLADAFEQLGQPDSAAACLERAVSGPSPVQSFGFRRGEGGRHCIAWPLAHRRLVLLYARMGRIEDAKRHWQIFAATYRTPDPELKPLIEEARAALASAEGMAKSPRQ